MPRASHTALALLILSTAALFLWPDRDTLSGKTAIGFTVWGMPFEDRLFLDRYARQWESLNPDIRVSYGRFADIRTKYNAWHARAEGPEVMRLEITWYHEFVKRGLLEPLSKYINDPASGLSAADLDAIPPHIREILTIDGELYAIPEDNAQFGLFYNKSLFDLHNNEHADDPVFYPSAEWTWDDLRATAKKLTRYDDSGRMTQAGFDVAIWSWPFLAFLYQAGGRMWSEDGLSCEVNSAAGVEALEFLRTLQREDRSFSPTLASYTAGVGADTLFASGRTAMFMDGSWRVPSLDLNTPNLNFAVAPLPRGKVPAIVTGSVLWGISKHAKHKDEGWKMLRWLIQDEQAAIYWDTLRVAPPANLRVLRSPAFRATAGVLKNPARPSDMQPDRKGGPSHPPSAYDVAPMPPEKYESRAAWLEYANSPHPRLNGRAPAFVPSGLYQSDLANEIGAMLNEYLKPESTVTAQAALGRVVRNMHSIIDRDRTAKGLVPAQRP